MIGRQERTLSQLSYMGQNAGTGGTGGTGSTGGVSSRFFPCVFYPFFVCIMFSFSVFIRLYVLALNMALAANMK